MQHPAVTTWGWLIASVVIYVRNKGRSGLTEGAFANGSLQKVVLKCTNGLEWGNNIRNVLSIHSYTLDKDRKTFYLVFTALSLNFIIIGCPCTHLLWQKAGNKDFRQWPWKSKGSQVIFAFALTTPQLLSLHLIVPKMSASSLVFSLEMVTTCNCLSFRLGC